MCEEKTNYTLLTDEPYTSEMYSSLLEPAFNQVRESYTLHNYRPIPRNKLTKQICKAACKGVFIGFLKATTKTAVKNMQHDYNQQENKGPIDLYFLSNYLNPKRYPVMLRGLTPELKVEVTYQVCQKSLATFSKYILRPTDMEFNQTLGIGFVRSFTSNLITASTVYPLSLQAFTDYSVEEILKKTFRRASYGSLMASFRSIGLSILSSLLPSQKQTFSVLLEIIG